MRGGRRPSRTSRRPGEEEEEENQDEERSDMLSNGTSENTNQLKLVVPSCKQAHKGRVCVCRGSSQPCSTSVISVFNHVGDRLSLVTH